MIVHPRKAALRAYTDGEGAPAERAELRQHLAACAECRARVEAFAAERAAVGSALASVAVAPDVAAGWARMQARIGTPVAAPRRAAGWSWWSAGAGSLATAAVALLAVVPVLRAPGGPLPPPVAAPAPAPEPDSVLERVQRLVVGRETAFVPAAAEQRLVTAALLALRDRGEAEVRNLCCGDYDAGGPSDDGFLTLNRPSQDVATVVVYEDLDKSGDLSPGDLIRFVSQRGVAEGAALDLPVAGGTPGPQT